MFQNLLVTGGCGFIGSNFIRYQLETYEDVRIINLDALTYAGNPENLADKENDSRYRFVRGSVLDRELVERLLREHRIDAVIHFAAESHVDRSILDSQPFIQTNIVGTQILLDASRQQEISRYVQVSTDEVYGSLPLGDGLFTESTPLDPRSPYSASKTSADLLVKAAYHTFEFPAIITRCSNNYGPWQFPEKLIPLFISNALNDRPLPVYGTGENVRDWIHVIDHCRGVDQALRQGQLGEVYNFGGAAEMSNLALTQLLLKLLGKPESLIQYVADRPGHDLRYAIDFSKAKRELNWEPTVTFEDGLKSTIEWYRNHAEWTARIQSGAYRQYYEQQYGERLNKD